MAFDGCARSLLSPPCARLRLSIPIRAITARPSLFPASHTRTATGQSCDWLSSSMKDNTGLPCSACKPIPDDLGSARPPGVQRLRGTGLERPNLTPCLLAQACQPLWLAPDDDGAAVHLH